MSKTAREVIADHVFGADISVRTPLGDVAANIIKALDAAGFVIVPKESTQQMIDAGKGPSSQFVDASSSQGGPRAWELESEQLAAIYRAMIAAASQDE